MVADREQIERRMYDDDEEVEDDITRFDDIANEDTGQAHRAVAWRPLTVAGGTLPEFGPDGALRPPRERGDDDTDDDGIPNDFDPFDNDEPEDGVTKPDLQFDGRVPGGRRAAVGDEATRAERQNPPAEFLYEHKWRIFGVMMIGWAMSLLDVSIVNISIPELQDEMSTDIGDGHLGHQRLQHRLRGPARVDGAARRPVRAAQVLRASAWRSSRSARRCARPPGRSSG